MTTRYGSVLSLPKGARKVNHTDQDAILHVSPAELSNSGNIRDKAERSPRPSIGAAKFSRSKALADALKSALMAAEDSCEDLPGDINGNC